MGTALFVTGTDTGVGKTLFACGLAALLRDSGYRVGVMKPAETGCPERDGGLFPEDAARLQRASGCELPLEVICPYRLREPLAPSIAAERQAVTIDADHLTGCFRRICSSHDVTLVEGAGGLLVPLLPSYTFADWTRALNLPLIVVAANRLGAINHLLLTLEQASCRGLRVIGYVLNQTTPERTLAAETNRETLAPMTSVPYFGELGYLEDSASRGEELARLLADQLDLRLLDPFLSPPTIKRPTR